MQFVEPRLREDRISTQPVAVDLRYSDLPESISLVVPTAEGFAGMKLMAWHQRQAPRDLYDLVALADICAITELAIGLTQEVTGARIDARAIDHELPGTVTNPEGKGSKSRAALRKADSSRRSDQAISPIS